MMKVTAISIWVLCLFCSELALTGALFCWECTQIANTSDCHLARECPDHNSCFTDAIGSDDRTVYSLGCRDTDQCGTTTQSPVGAIVGRAMVDVTCSQCCSQNTCNRALCSPSTHNPVTNSTCADTKDFDCPTVSAAISLCADIDRAKKVCKKWCDLCEIDGGWSQWTSWTGCDVTCSTGKMTRHRSCTNPAPKNGGVDCLGNSTMFKSCTTSACPVHGGWTRWSPWGSCSVTCGVGLRRRDRTCSNPYTSAGGDYCSGDTRDDKICFERTCADGGWTGWAAWGSCSVSCGGGMKSRSRSCTSPAPSTFGKQCPGDSHEAAICLIEPCNASVDFNLLFVQPEITPSVTAQCSNVDKTEGSSRFTTMTDSDVNEFLAQQQNKNTKMKTGQNMSLLVNFLEGQGETRSIETMTPAELCDYLTKFVLSVRKKDGEEYEPSSLRAFISSFDRHLKNKGYEYSISNDRPFASCMEALKAKSKQLNTIGKGNKPQAASSISDTEIDTLFKMDQMGPKTPTSLQNSMWYIFASQFGIRTGTEIHSLCWGDIGMGHDEEGVAYLQYNQERQTKTRTGANPKDIRPVKPRAYETPDTPSRCPVKLFQQYAARRPASMLDENSPFFLTVNPNYQKTDIWFKNCHMGLNKIYKIMKNMKESANIGENKRLTPYSVRKHMVQKLSDAGVPPNQIIQISGHKNVNSLNNYSAINENQQKQISRTLSNTREINGKSRASETFPNPNNATQYMVDVQETESPVPRSNAVSQLPATLFKNNQISGNINIHLHNHTCNKQSNTSFSVSQASNSPSPERPYKRIRRDSDSD